MRRVLVGRVVCILMQPVHEICSCGEEPTESTESTESTDAEQRERNRHDTGSNHNDSAPNVPDAPSASTNRPPSYRIGYSGLRASPGSTGDLLNNADACYVPPDLFHNNSSDDVSASSDSDETNGTTRSGIANDLLNKTSAPHGQQGPIDNNRSDDDPGFDVSTFESRSASQDSDEMNGATHTDILNAYNNSSDDSSEKNDVAEIHRRATPRVPPASSNISLKSTDAFYNSNNSFNRNSSGDIPGINDVPNDPHAPFVTTRPIRTRGRRARIARKTRTPTFSAYIRRVLHSLPGRGRLVISKEAILTLNGMLFDHMEKLSLTAGQLCHSRNRRTLMSTDIQAALKLSIPPQLFVEADRLANAALRKIHERNE